LVAALYRIAQPLWEPTAADWWETGRLVRDIGDAEHWEASERREFQNDALIALTARRYGAAVVTHNRGGFSHLSRRLGIRVITASD
jgi:predicted nucleic acid-binding protein